MGFCQEVVAIGWPDVFLGESAGGFWLVVAGGLDDF